MIAPLNTKVTTAQKLDRQAASTFSEFNACISSTPKSASGGVIDQDRLAKQFDRAEQIAQSATIPVEWSGAWHNERAALLWHQGKADAAIAAWTAQPASLPVRFNLAMAGLFTGKNVKADLENVMAELPERSAWHHLARLYHTLSAMR